MGRARGIDRVLRLMRRKNPLLYWNTAIRLLREAGIDWLADKFEEAKRHDVFETEIL